MPFHVHNPALRKTVGQCLTHGWAVHLCCSAGHSARWNVSRLAEDFAPEVTLEAIAERLVCRACGSTEGEIDIFQDVAHTQARDIARFEASGKTPGTGRP